MISNELIERACEYNKRQRDKKQVRPWQIYRNGQLVPYTHPSFVHVAGVVYVMTDGVKHYIGVTTRLDSMDAYWSSGANSVRYFREHQADVWRVVLKLVPAMSCPFQAEAAYQDYHRKHIINNNYQDGGSWLNLRIGMPGMECYWQHPESTRKQGSGSHCGHTGGGGRSPILMKLLNGEYLRFETSKAASAWLGITQNGGLLRQYLVDANWNVVPHDHPHSLRNADPSSRYRMKGVEWVCYDR